MFTRGLILVLCLCATFFSVLTPTTHAQLPSGAQAAEVTVSPAYPEPFTEVEVSLEAYAYNLNGASIRWFINGIEQIDQKNARSITLVADEAGTDTTVRAQIVLATGTVLSAQKTITPSRVDIAIESESIVPLFYRGRALPSTGSTIRAVAIPFVSAGASTLTYTWKLNNKVLFGGPVVGKNVATFEAPYGGTQLLSVEIADANGVIFTRKLLEVQIVAPQILFYEDNPLRGLSNIALRSPYPLVQSEMTVRAEPYYMSENIFSRNVLTEWKINGRTIENPSTNPQNITLRKDGGTGSFTVDFSLRNLDNLLQGATEDFVVTF